ncbi:hypothetical protein C8R43DRAFT_1109921 [Mycena crocata]|nr:hypothetical protein C8R43DRAFT_1109921 [Mycena crocata]
MDEPTDEPQVPSHRYTFPPFPPAPPGFKIPAFKDFQEFGTRIVKDGIEHDGLGIPTIRLPPPTKKGKSKKKKSHALQTGPKKEWWEEWEAQSAQLPVIADESRLDPVDRFHQAATEFQKYYPLPQLKHMQQLWTGFQNFAGLAPSSLKTSNPVVDEDEMMSDDDDFPNEEAVFNNPVPSDGANIDDAATDIKDDPKSKEMAEDNQDLNESELEPVAIFLSDPPRAMQVFLSSYMRQHGLMWDPAKLLAAPRLMRFFANSVLQPPIADAPMLARTLAVIDTATRELPAIPTISNALPDAFGAACRARLGRRADGFEFVVKEDEGTADKDTSVAKGLAKEEDAAKTLPASDAHTHERDATRGAAEDADESHERDTKRAKLEHTPAPDASIEELVSPALADVPATIIKEDAAALATNENAPDAITNGTEPSNEDVPMDDVNASGWGSGGWGAGGWGGDDEVRLADGAVDGNAPLANGSAPPNVQSLPALPAAATLETLLGHKAGTALPRTHAPGVVEWSVRRVVEVVPPVAAVSVDAGSAKVADVDVDTTTPEAVECALEKRLWRVVLAPWLGWDGDVEREKGDKAAGASRILRSSRGAVVGEVATTAETDGSATPAQSNLKPHDPLADEITLLLDGAAAKTLVVGMGLGGTWVQLARVGDLPGVGVEDSVVKEELSEPEGEKEGRVNANFAQRYWYMEELIIILPSYWAV